MFVSGLLSGHRILVTGGGTGLGKEIASHLLSLGADIYICGRRETVLVESADELINAHGGSVKTVVLDLRDPAAVEAAIDRVWQDGPLTGLVNNAAGNFISRTEDLSSRGFDAIADTVFHGTFYITHAVGKRWIAERLKGSILSIVTTWVRTGAPFVVPSAMSKAGIDAMTKSLATEWGRYGIRLNAIAPGIFPTEGATARLRPGSDPHSLETNSNPMRRLGRMPELTNLAAFLMADGCEWLTGETIAIDGAYHLAQGAYFTHYMDWTDEQWQEARDRIKAQTEQDKLLRTTKP
ncbi:SDR family oxidoreductase [Candidimonas sp. SYP-B2681]|uniref:SDR family oxidoreductase n=1 Tax=Candidimonas sp. SYP-B2681 TaxID=2497686 RepID=UPI000F88ADEF|nr:SDR family oxidoreductase [Candidimonas sp. SYP-B2681]RTZ43432.1 SDR family oxidoreductase [Candidimonas sp. SYP-B2681]